MGVTITSRPGLEEWDMIDIGYEFKDVGLLRLALTHRSAGPNHNEKLEFLGDSVVDLYMASRLMALMPDGSEGALAARREQLVCEAAMTRLAIKAGIDRALVMGRSVGGKASPRMLADAMEAVIGAAFLDGGIAAVKAIDHRIGLVP